MKYLVRIRNTCPTCEGTGGTESLWCVQCGGYGYVDESDAAFRVRMMAAMRDERAEPMKPAEILGEREARCSSMVLHYFDQGIKR